MAGYIFCIRFSQQSTVDGARNSTLLENSVTDHSNIYSKFFYYLLTNRVGVAKVSTVTKFSLQRVTNDL
jgi:hypothetical protein